MNTNSIAGILQVLVPTAGAWLVGHGYIPSNVWTEIGTIVVALGGAGWSANTTSVAPPATPPVVK